MVAQFDPVLLFDNIAGLTVVGLDIRTLSNLPQAIYERDCPIVIPAYDALLNYRWEPGSMGLSTIAFETVPYIIKYRLYFHQVGMGARYITESVAGIAAITRDFVRTVGLAGTQLGPERVLPVGGIAATSFSDPSEKNTFHGCEIMFSAVDFENL